MVTGWVAGGRWCAVVGGGWRLTGDVEVDRGCLCVWMVFGLGDGGGYIGGNMEIPLCLC